jgi:hypothetical protein
MKVTRTLVEWGTSIVKLIKNFGDRSGANLLTRAWQASSSSTSSAFCILSKTEGGSCIVVVIMTAFVLLLSLSLLLLLLLLLASAVGNDRPLRGWLRACDMSS